MQEVPYVLFECEEINPLLYKPINSTQRIKYTCFNISPNYIILGSTSGSIYLFSRKPCSFIQLIPLSEGAVSRILISPDEKIIALTTTRGIVCLVGLKPVPKLIAISAEHVQEQINCLCWNDNSSEVYIGDGNGKISVMVLSIFTVNGMFQAPACTLMNLDSAIVQLSFSTPLLLVSTLTRCYICDTVQEQYKQVGNKARNGEFGACFYKKQLTENTTTLITQKDKKLVNRRGTFNFITDSNNKIQEGNFPQIFCARPGSRLWEVSADGTVLKTHQFKEALAVPSITIIRKNIRPSLSQKHIDQTWLPQSINFSHLSIIAEKYLLSYTHTGLYIIDPVSASIVLWNSEFSNLYCVETIENKIYLMTSNAEFHCLTLSSLDSLVVRLYNRKEYYECLEVCLLYKDHLKTLINKPEMKNICDMESKLQSLRIDELSTLLHPLIFLLESTSKVIPKKLNSGIVVVNCGNADMKEEECSRHNSISHSTMQDSTNSFEIHLKTNNEKLTNFVNNPINDAKINENPNSDTGQKTTRNKDEELLEAKEELNADKSIIEKMQADLESIYVLVSDIRPSIDETEMEKLILEVDWRVNVIKDSYEAVTDLRSFIFEMLKGVELHYFNTLLENISVHMIQLTENENIIKQVINAFININEQSYRRCTCGSIYPTNELVEPKFLDIGKILLKKIVHENEEQCLSLCNKVPYLWRNYLPLYTDHNSVLANNLVQQCLQIRDNILLSILLPLVDSKQWNFVAMYIKELQQGQCLFCGKLLRKGNHEVLVNWTAVIYETMKKQGPDMAMTLLMKVEKVFPNVPIDRNIFQSLIFTKLLYQHGMKCAISFNKNNFGSSEYNAMCSPKIRDQLLQVLEKDLKKPVNKNIFGSGPHHWGMHYLNRPSTCPCCTLSLDTPVLLGNNGIAIFDCGHTYHVNCMIEKRITACNLHN